MNAVQPLPDTPAHSISDSVRRQIIAASARLPSLAHIFERMNQALRNPDVSVDEIGDIIRMDAAVALRVMRLANSAQFMRSEPFSNLESAIDWIGITHIYQLLAATVSARLYCDQLPAYGLSEETIWKNSIATGTAMALLAEAVGEDKRRAYSLGLFRPVGRLVLQKIARQRHLALDPALRSNSQAVLDWERTSFEVDNAAAVAVVFEAWGLNSILGDCIRIHFNPLASADAPQAPLAALLYIAGWMAQQAGHGLAVEADAWTVTPAITTLARLPRFNLDGYVARTREITTRLTLDPLSN